MLRVAIEEKANVILGQTGLSGCFDFLHDLALTHKVNTLRMQAQEMSRGAWSGTLRVEIVHRLLVVQYWTGLASKSWVEIGIDSNKSDKRAWLGPQPSKLGVRWFRNSVEVKSAGFAFDWTVLSMEMMLRQVIARHMTLNLEAIKNALPNAQGGQGLSSLTLGSSDEEGSECVLRFAVKGQREAITLSQEAVTGRMVLQPPSPLAERAEVDLNDQKRQDGKEQTLTRFCAREMQTHTEQQAELLGWRSL
jgi:mediator of RNA polymerase II transcription subunit 14